MDNVSTYAIVGIALICIGIVMLNLLSYPHSTSWIVLAWNGVDNTLFS